MLLKTEGYLKEGCEENGLDGPFRAPYNKNNIIILGVASISILARDPSFQKTTQNPGEMAGC